MDFGHTSVKKESACVSFFGIELEFLELVDQTLEEVGAHLGFEDFLNSTPLLGPLLAVINCLNDALLDTFDFWAGKISLQELKGFGALYNILRLVFFQCNLQGFSVILCNATFVATLSLVISSLLVVSCGLVLEFSERSQIVFDLLLALLKCYFCRRAPSFWSFDTLLFLAWFIH